MKVEKKGKCVFEPIVVTLETEEEAQCMRIISCVRRKETLTECCERIKKDFSLEISLSEVDSFGTDLNDNLYDLLDC